jgi:hypothetical protein
MFKMLLHLNHTPALILFSILVLVLSSQTLCGWDFFIFFFRKDYCFMCSQYHVPSS